MTVAELSIKVVVFKFKLRSGLQLLRVSTMSYMNAYSYPKKGSPRRTVSSNTPVPIRQLNEGDISRRNLSAPEPSRLLIMQNRYQKQLLREKEAKLIKMYEENQDAALARAIGSGAKRGFVRDFFRERHEIHVEQSKSAPTLDITEHFRQKKLQNIRGIVKREEEKERQLHHMKRANGERLSSQHQHAGLSRSNPLAPIRKRQSQSMENMYQPESSHWMYNEPTDHLEINQPNEFNRMQFQQKQPLNSQTRAIPHNSNKASTCKSNITPKWEPSTPFPDLEDENEKPVTTKHKSLKLKARPHVKPKRTHAAKIKDCDEEGSPAVTRSKQGKLQVQYKQQKNDIAKKKPAPKWRPPATYSDEDDEATQIPSPNFTKVAQMKKKPDQYSHLTKQSGNTPKMSEYQKWQLDQDLDRANRLENYQKQFESKRQPDIDYRFDHDMQEQKAKQRQRTGEFDEMEQQQRYMKELEEKIARKQLELAKLGHDSELDDSPHHQSKLDTTSMINSRSSQSNTKLNSKSESRHGNQILADSAFSSNSRPCGDTSPLASNESFITKPVTVQSRGNPKSKRGRNQQKQNSSPVLTPDNCDEIPQSSTANYYAEITEASSAVGEVLDLQGCPTCGRHFAIDRLAKHAKICQKTAKKKPRKVFDTRKQRLGTELATYVDHEQHRKHEGPKKKSNWREKHSELIRAIQDARKVQNHVAKGGDLRDLPPPVRSQHSDYKQCPYCQRRFDPVVAERHMPKCKEIKSRPPPPKRTNRR